MLGKYYRVVHTIYLILSIDRHRRWNIGLWCMPIAKLLTRLGRRRGSLFSALQTKTTLTMSFKLLNLFLCVYKRNDF